MTTLKPTIALLDPRPTVLSGRVEVPTRFRATFEDLLTTSIEIELVSGSPVVRAITMSSDTDDLASKDLRPALRSKLVPAAIRAASREVLIGPSLSNQKASPVPRNELPATGEIGPIVVIGRRANSADDYDAAEQQTRRRRPGRPKHTTDPDVLRRIAEVYMKRRSLADIETQFPDPPMSKTTAHRRVQEARKAGLIE